MDNRNYFTMAIPALLLGVAYLQPINAAPAEDLPNVTGRMTITQQTFTVSGVVTDTNGEPIIGANVIEKGTTNGAVTDFDGKFSLSLQNKQSILVVTYIGYNTKEIPAGNGSPLTIQLQDDTQNLDEVIVVGYSVQKKKDLTGAVSVLEVGDLKDTPVSSVDQMMQGKLSGVNVIPDNMPGGGVAVRVRGFSTIRNNDPLYIIDGVPVEGGINFLNPNDIERCFFRFHLWRTCGKRRGYHQYKKREGRYFPGKPRRLRGSTNLGKTDAYAKRPRIWRLIMAGTA